MHTLFRLALLLPAIALPFALHAQSLPPNVQAAANELPALPPPPASAPPADLSAPPPVPLTATGGQARYSPGRIVRFTYDPNQIYTLVTLPGGVTDIVLAPGERLVTLALGDTASWITSHDAGDVYIKPARAGLYTSGTLVTSLHRYQLLFVSVSAGSDWYQEVVWQPASIIAFDQIAPASVVPQAQTSSSAQVSEQVQSADAGVRVSPLADTRLDTRYQIAVASGRPDFVPTQVYDNGVSTYIEIPPGAQEWPALFVVHDRVPSVVNYMVSGRWIVYPHLFGLALLKLGRESVTITRGAN